MSSSMDLERLSCKPVLSAGDCEWLVKEMDSLPAGCWITREEMHGRRALDDTSCRYKICANLALPVHIREFLKLRSPLDLGRLRELVINSYAPGDWIPEHRDKHMYRDFVVIPLQEKGDGLFVEGTWFEDRMGMGLFFEGISHKHSVPPVKSSRYTLIYLYE